MHSISISFVGANFCPQYTILIVIGMPLSLDDAFMDDGSIFPFQYI